ncbi:MAG: class I SAM-dependent methyltransferase [Patescibacteria group bacterium]
MKNTPNSGDYSLSLNSYVISQVPDKSVCLDVGCWTGNLGKFLKEKKDCIVDGIDVADEPLQKAKKNGYRETYKINLNNDPLRLDQLKKYDVIIFADVLEHLVNPPAILSQMKKKLKTDGTVIISLPNVAFLLNRLLLLFGKWDYREFGTLDKTHLRFYTIDSVQKMVESAGFTVTKVKPYNQFGLLRYIAPLTALFPSLFAYQILLVAKPK